MTLDAEHRVLRSILDVSMDLFGTGLDGDKKTGKGVVLNKSFAADEGARIWKRTRIAILSVKDTVG